MPIVGVSNLDQLDSALRAPLLTADLLGADSLP
jgi:hypothetical protein